MDTPAPASLQTLPLLQAVGNNGSPASAYPLQRCMGDCDGDADVSSFPLFVQAEVLALGRRHYVKASANFLLFLHAHR